MEPGMVAEVGRHRVVVERFLAEGGLARVYLARLADGQPVVLKRIQTADPQSFASFQREVEVMKILSGHRNVVSYIDAAVSPGIVLILMEYCPGGHVVDLMNRRLKDRLKEHEILKIYADACEGVARMHYMDQPIIHRDLKVENLLLATSGDFKLCDFGSATTKIIPPRSSGRTLSATDIELLDEDIMKHTTLQYRAPELCDLWAGKGISEKIDIWALGVMLYKLCFYTTPFEEGGVMAILNRRYVIPKEPAYHPDVIALIDWCLQEDPKARPSIYQLVASMSALRGVPCPIENKYGNISQPLQVASTSNTSHSPARMENVGQRMPLQASPHSTTTTTTAGARETAIAMRRGRPSKSLSSNAIPANGVSITSTTASTVPTAFLSSIQASIMGINASIVNTSASLSSPSYQMQQQPPLSATSTAKFDMFEDNFGPSFQSQENNHSRQNSASLLTQESTHRSNSRPDFSGRVASPNMQVSNQSFEQVINSSASLASSYSASFPTATPIYADINKIGGSLLDLDDSNTISQINTSNNCNNSYSNMPVPAKSPVLFSESKSPSQIVTFANHLSGSQSFNLSPTGPSLLSPEPAYVTTTITTGASELSCVPISPNMYTPRYDSRQFEHSQSVPGQYTPPISHSTTTMSTSIHSKRPRAVTTSQGFGKPIIYPLNHSRPQSISPHQASEHGVHGKSQHRKSYSSGDQAMLDFGTVVSDVGRMDIRRSTSPVNAEYLTMTGNQQQHGKTITCLERVQSSIDGNLAGFDINHFKVIIMDIWLCSVSRENPLIWLIDVLRRLPFQSDPVVCLKVLHLLHCVKFYGPPVALQDLCSRNDAIRGIQQSWISKANAASAPLIVKYTELLSDILRLQEMHPLLEGCWSNSVAVRAYDESYINGDFAHALSKLLLDADQWTSILTDYGTEGTQRLSSRGDIRYWILTLMLEEYYGALLLYMFILLKLKQTKVQDVRITVCLRSRNIVAKKMAQLSEVVEQVIAVPASEHPRYEIRWRVLTEFNFDADFPVYPPLPTSPKILRSMQARGIKVETLALQWNLEQPHPSILQGFRAFGNVIPGAFNDFVNEDGK